MRNFFPPPSSFHLFLNDISHTFTDSDFFADESRLLAIPSALFFAHRRLKNHTIRTANVLHKDLCKLQCYKELNCVSINLTIEANKQGDVVPNYRKGVSKPNVKVNIRLRTKGKSRKHEPQARLVFSTFLECSQMSGVFYPSVIHS